MFNKYFFIATFLFLGGCSSIPDVALPNLPFLEMADPESESESESESAKQDTISQLAGYESRGDGYLSFNYNEGHLETITVILSNEEIVLSQGQTVIKKLPVGKYSFEVLGNQKYSRNYSARLFYNGDTKKYVFNIPSPSSKIEYISSRYDNLKHRFGDLIVGSSLINPLIEITKVDQPTNVFIECSDKECNSTDNFTYSGPLIMSLPEGKYLLNASGRSKELYVDGDSKNTIEITSIGFEVSRESRWIRNV